MVNVRKKNMDHKNYLNKILLHLRSLYNKMKILVTNLRSLFWLLLYWVAYYVHSCKNRHLKCDRIFYQLVDLKFHYSIIFILCLSGFYNPYSLFWNKHLLIFNAHYSEWQTLNFEILIEWWTIQMPTDILKIPG